MKRKKERRNEGNERKERKKEGKKEKTKILYTCKQVCFIYKHYSLTYYITKLSQIAASLRRNKK